MIAKSVLYEEMPDNSLMILHEGEFYRIFGKATQIFLSLRSGKSNEQVEKLFLAEEKGSKEIIKKEIGIFLDDLANLGILQNNREKSNEKTGKKKQKSLLAKKAKSSKKK